LSSKSEKLDMMEDGIVRCLPWRWYIFPRQCIRYGSNWNRWDRLV